MFWLDNPKVLLESKNIVPGKNMSYDEKLNSIVRFAILFYIVIVLINGDKKWTSVSITLIVLTVVFRNDKKVKKYLENFVGECEESTVNNPYGNFTINEYLNNKEKKQTCDESVEEREKKAMSNMNHILPDSMYDEGNINFRDFYTLPVTTIVNDQTEFAKSLLGSSGDCKHDGVNCLKDENTKLHRSRVYDNYSLDY